MQLKISPIIYKSIFFQNAKTFFDIYSKKIITLTPTTINIYDKTGTKLKKEIPLKLKR